MLRKVKKYLKGNLSQDGAGVKLRRMFGYHDLNEFDPFLLLDFFDSTNPADYLKGFPWHPHRGIETITYLIEGEIDHGDSLGNKGAIKSGQCQWMKAGSGIIHQELPRESNLMLGVQVWLNLAAADKMSKPEYGDLSADRITTYQDSKKTVHILAGEFANQKGPIQREKTKPTFLDVELTAESEFNFQLPAEQQVFAFLIRGKANFEVNSGKFVESPTIVLYESGTEIKVKTGERKARFFLIAGQKLAEPVAWGGPIVMNTREELVIASRELDNNSFIKTDAELD